MNPPYLITPEILNLIVSISEKIGQINAKFLDKPIKKLFVLPIPLRFHYP